MSKLYTSLKSIIPKVSLKIIETDDSGSSD